MLLLQEPELPMDFSRSAEGAGKLPELDQQQQQKMGEEEEEEVVGGRREAPAHHQGLDLTNRVSVLDKLSQRIIRFVRHPVASGGAVKVKRTGGSEFSERDLMFFSSQSDSFSVLFFRFFSTQAPTRPRVSTQQQVIGRSQRQLCLRQDSSGRPASLAGQRQAGGQEHHAADLAEPRRQR